MFAYKDIELVQNYSPSFTQAKKGITHGHIYRKDSVECIGEFTTIDIPYLWKIRCFAGDKETIWRDPQKRRNTYKLSLTDEPLKDIAIAFLQLRDES